MQNRSEISRSESKAIDSDHTPNADESGSIHSDDTAPWEVGQHSIEHEGENGHQAPEKPWIEQTSEEKIQEFIRRESMGREKSNLNIADPGFDPNVSFDIDHNTSPVANEPAVAPTLAVTDVVPTIDEAPVSSFNPASMAALLDAFGMHSQARNPISPDTSRAPKGCCIIS